MSATLSRRQRRAARGGRNIKARPAAFLELKLENDLTLKRQLIELLDELVARGPKETVSFIAWQAGQTGDVHGLVSMLDVWLAKYGLL